MAREWIRPLAWNTSPNLAVPGTGYATPRWVIQKGKHMESGKTGKAVKTRIPRTLQDVVQNFPSQTNSMMSGTTTDGATCNKM